MSQSETNEPEIDGYKLSLVSIVSGLIWLLIANLIIYYIQDRQLADVFFSGHHFLIQIGIGLVAGTLFGAAGLWMARLPSFKKILDEYAIIRQIKQMDLSVNEMVYVSLIAGISEEILFRGAIQPVLGIWFTSILFIGVHGYIRMQSTKHALYSFYTFLLSTMLGALFIYLGLISAIIAHFIYDVIVLYGIKKEAETDPIST